MVVMMIDTPRTPSLTRRSLGTLALGGTLTAVLAACGNGNGSGGSDAGGDGAKPSVVTTCYPMRYLAEKVGGDRISIIDPVKPGVDPHGLELSTQQVAEVAKATVILQIPGYQLAVDDALAAQKLTDRTLDVSTVTELLPAENASHDHSHGHDHEGHEHDGHDHGDEHASDGGGDHDHEGHDHGDHDHEGHDHDHDDHGHDGHDHGQFDPHVWHDPTKLAEIAGALAKRLGEADQQNAKAYRDAAAAFAEEMSTLDGELKKKFGEVESDSRTFITSHLAFGYLAARYGLHQVGIAGIDPENEPSPKRLAELQQLIKDEGVHTVFFEETASPKVAQALAKNAGAEAEELDNLEQQLDPKKDYARVMHENADALVASWT